MKKITLSTLLSLSALAFAQEGSCDVQCGPCTPMHSPTPSVAPTVECGWNLFLNAEFLYWTARQKQMEFAFTGSSSASQSQDITQKGNYFAPDWKMEPGFKVGLGWISCHDGWDLFANYTWLRTNSTKETIPDSEVSEGITGLNWDTNNFPDALAQNSINFQFNWEHDFNVLDLELGRDFFISCALTLRPHFGLKGTWQEQRVRAMSTSRADNSVFGGRHKIDTWAIGPRAGLDSMWQLSPCFGILGEVALSALWQRFEVDAFSVNTTDVEATTNINTCNNFHTLSSVVEFFLGLRYQDWFCCSSFRIAIDAGWETQIWEDQNQFLTAGQFSGVNARLGNLSLQGLTVRCRFDF